MTKKPGNIEEFSTGHLMPGRASLIMSSDRKIVNGRDGLDIEYNGIDNCPYGESATRDMKPIIGIVLHHTSNDHSTDWYVKYQIEGDRGRIPSGHYGYHFYISPEGRIVQGAPLTVPTNHISPSKSVRRDFGKIFMNTNSVGVSCVGAGRDDGFHPTGEQTQAAKKLTFALCDLFSIPFSNVVGHGEIQTNRVFAEGRSIALYMRGLQD